MFHGRDILEGKSISLKCPYNALQGEINISIKGRDFVLDHPPFREYYTKDPGQSFILSSYSSTVSLNSSLGVSGVRVALVPNPRSYDL